MSCNVRNAPRTLRLGIVPYLNALPLVEADPRLRWVARPPVRLVRDLKRGAIDAGLLPSFAFACDPSLLLVPGVCIASCGKVGSVRLFCRTPISRARRIALDPDSVTSVALLKILCARRWKISPRFVHRREDAADAVLRIGDAGLPEREGCRAVDLGEVWTRWTGLPFVYALWTVRRGRVPPELSAVLADSARKGHARLGRIVREAAARTGFSRARLDRYLRREIRYRFGAEEKKGLRRFYREARIIGLVPRARELEYA